MILTPAQNQIAADLHRFRVVNCGRRFGKTTLAVEEIKGKAIAKPSRIAYIATTFQQARDLAWGLLKSELDGVAIDVNESRLEIRVNTIRGGESIIFLRGWESIETLRGQYFDFIVVDEIASMRNFWAMWQEVVRPTLTDKRGEALFISTPKGFNHFYELFNLQSVGLDGGPGDKDFISFHFTSYDNPHVPTEEIDKAKKELTEDRFAQEYLADFRKTEGLVYKEFDRAIHLYDSPQPGMPDVIGRVRETIAGVDFGYHNPCAILTIIQNTDGVYYIDDEFYESGKTDSQIGEIIAAKGFNKVYPDPESPSAIAELRARRVNVREVIKNKDSIKNGIQRVRELLKSKKLFINSRCKNTIYELETYCYPEKKDLKNEEENPIKENDHAMDAMRYALYMQDPLGRDSGANSFYPHVQGQAVTYRPIHRRR